MENPDHPNDPLEIRASENVRVHEASLIVNAESVSAARVEITFPVAPPEGKLQQHFERTIKWSRQDPHDKIWLVQLYDADGHLLDIHLDASKDDALAEFLEHLMPPDDDAG